MIRKFVVLALTIFLFAVPLVNSQTYADKAMYGEGEGSYSYYTDEDPRFVDWYDVSDAELEFCSMWGGIRTVSDYYGSGAVEGDDSEVSQLTFTIQAKKTTYSETAYLYEVAWYVHPFGEDLTYSVYLIDEDGDTDELYTGFAEALPGDTGYEAFESETNYEEAQLVLEGERTEVTIPFVDKS